MSKKQPEMTEVTAKPPPPTYNSSSSDAPPPPPYTYTSNPGFCALAFAERASNALPNGGMTSDDYFLPCSACTFTCGTAIPPSYKIAWPQWVDPSVNFRWESHTGVAVVNGEKTELLGCWICWEYEQNWVKPMMVEEWYLHMRKHFHGDGYRVCKGKKGGMQRRRNCPVFACPKVHS